MIDIGWRHWLSRKQQIAINLHSDIEAIDECRFGAMGHNTEILQIRAALQQALHHIEHAMALVKKRHPHAEQS